MNKAIHYRIIYITILMAQTFRNDDLGHITRQGTIIYQGASKVKEDMVGIVEDGSYQY